MDFSKAKCYACFSPVIPTSLLPSNVFFSPFASNSLQNASELLAGRFSNAKHRKPPNILEQLEASCLPREDSENTCNWVLSIIQLTEVRVSGDPEAAPRQSIIALTLGAVVTDEIKKKEGLCYGLSRNQE